MISFRQEIKDTLDELMGECEGIRVPEPESTKYTNEILKIIEKRIDERADNLLDVYHVDTENIDLLEGRGIDEIPGPVVYLKALIDIKGILKK